MFSKKILNFSLSLNKQLFSLNVSFIQNSSFHASRIIFGSESKRSLILKKDNFGEKRFKNGRMINREKSYEKNFIFKGRSAEHISGVDLSVDIDEKLNKLDDDIELYAANENLYHDKVVYEDISERRRKKLAIVNKKIAKLEGRKEPVFNLLTWDAKEQIKHLHLNDPGN